MMLADTIPTWPSTIAVLAMVASAISLICGALVVYYMRRQTEVMAAAAAKPAVPQPLNVEVVKALHDQFADKEEYAAHVISNTDRHAQLFRKIEHNERAAREALTVEINKINEDRRRTLEKLNEQFTFIRESVAAINTELRITSEHKK